MKINIDALESGVIKYIERIRQCKVTNFNSFTGQEEVAMTENVMKEKKKFHRQIKMLISESHFYIIFNTDQTGCQYQGTLIKLMFRPL